MESEVESDWLECEPEDELFESLESELDEESDDLDRELLDESDELELLARLLTLESLRELLLELDPERLLDDELESLDELSLELSDPPEKLELDESLEDRLSEDELAEGLPDEEEESLEELESLELLEESELLLELELLLSEELLPSQQRQPIVR